MRRLLSGLRMSGLAFGLLSTAWADDLAGDIARIHVEAIGGKARVERLKSVRAAGIVRLGDNEMEFQMWAARPNRIRIEVARGSVTLVQGWDGETEPWLQEGTEGQLITMKGQVAMDFKGDSEFDDPLFRPKERGYTLEYAGEEEVEGGSVVKLLVTRSMTDQVTLYLASDTYFIVREDRSQRLMNGEVDETQTYYDDFRPVLGVTLPHSITMQSGDEILSQTVLTWIEPNPPVEDDYYEKPGE